MDDRLKVVKILIIVLFLVLIMRAGYLQIVMGDYYYQLSEGNRLSSRPINAPRGKMLDKNGQEVLVSNKLSYNIYFLKNELPREINLEELINRLNKLTGLEINQNDIKDSNVNILKRNISPETMVIIKENNEQLPGILVRESSIRDYVYNDLAAHILGYVGEINVQELKGFNQEGYNYSGGDIVGKSGLEKEYEYYLKGVDGLEQIEVNSTGEMLRVIGKKAPVRGNNIYLTLDIELQKRTEELLKDNFKMLREEAEGVPELDKPSGAAAIVMAPKTGEILAMASIPSYDLNAFAEGFNNSDYNKLLNDSLNPLLNRAIMAAVPPGSIFKLVTGTAAITYLGINEKTEFIDNNGKFYIPNWSRPYKNWHEGGEGKIDFITSISNSNNIIFYQLGYELYTKYYGEKLTDTARKYGLGSKTNIDLPGEKSGLVPDREWKKDKYNEGWYPGDSVNLSIGQGGLLTTPIQLVQLISSIANNGYYREPYLVARIKSPDGEFILNKKFGIKRELSFDTQVFKTLKKGMAAVVKEGTASRALGDFPVAIAGKTGTAQTSNINANHGWFAGFAPVNEPEIAVLVFLENGNKSGYTLPIARGIFASYFGLNNPDNKTEVDPGEYYQEDNSLLGFFKKVFSD